METHRAMNDLADAIDPRKVLDTSPTGQSGIVMWRPSSADLIAASDALRSLTALIQKIHGQVDAPVYDSHDQFTILQVIRELTKP